MGYLLRKKGVGCTEQAQISPTAFFCGCRLSAAAAGSHPPQKFPRWGQTHRKQGDERAEAGTNFPTAFFFCGCRLSAAAAGSHPTDDGKIHRCRRCSAGRAREQQTGAGVQLAGLENSKRGQVFSWPGSRTANGGRCSAGRAPAARAETLKNANGKILFSQLGKLCRGRLLRI